MRDDIVINDNAKAISSKLIDTLETIYDPELELDMYNLGLIYEINLDDNGHCKVIMTFTEASCGCADTMPVEVVEKLKAIDEITSAEVEIVWTPAWKMSRISRLGRIALGISPRIGKSSHKL